MKKKFYYRISIALAKVENLNYNPFHNIHENV